MSRPGGPFVLELHRRVPGTRERVFDALTRPEALTVWWGPRLFTTGEIELDLRVGGRYRFTMHPPEGDPFHLSGSYREIDRPAALAYTFRWDEPTPDDRETVVRLTLADAGGGTDLSVRQGEFTTAERLDLHRGGWSDSLDRLVAFLGGDG
jgi:uncharacterized protein YndB with AHSA1/START domain